MTSFREKRLKCLEMTRLADAIVFIAISLIVLTLAIFSKSNNPKTDPPSKRTEKDTIYFQ